MSKHNAKRKLLPELDSAGKSPKYRKKQNSKKNTLGNQADLDLQKDKQNETSAGKSAKGKILFTRKSGKTKLKVANNATKLKGKITKGVALNNNATISAMAGNRVHDKNYLKEKQISTKPALIPIIQTRSMKAKSFTKDKCEETVQVAYCR